MTFYISIGNSDDKLTQKEWAEFVGDVDMAIVEAEPILHGRWFSRSDSPWQNACWCIQLSSGVDKLRRRLGDLAHKYRQDSVAWAEAPVTEFLS